MEICNTNDILELENKSEISTTISEMMLLLRASNEKIEGIQKQKWYQRMIYSVFGKNKASLKEIEENRNKINKYVAEALAEMYKKNMISDAYIVSLGDRINEISYSNVLLRKNLIEIASALNEKIDSVDNYHILRGLIEEGKFSNLPCLFSLISIVASCDKRVLNDEDHVWLLEKTLTKSRIISNDLLIIADELTKISALNENEISGLYLETCRNSSNDIVSKIFIAINKIYQTKVLGQSSNLGEITDMKISGSELFSLLIEEKREYYLLLDAQKQEMLEEQKNVDNEIDLAAVIGVYNKEAIPVRDEILSKRVIDTIIDINETTTFEKEEIHINNQINCNGNLYFSNSIIYLNEDKKGNIVISEGATLGIDNCLIISKDFCKRSFIKIEDGFAYCNNSILEECSFLFENSADNNCEGYRLRICHCELNNCGPQLIYSNCQREQGISELVNCKVLWMQETELLSKIMSESNGSFIVGRSWPKNQIKIKNCEFEGNSYNKSWDVGGLINVDIIEGTKFERVSGNIQTKLLSNCVFKDVTSEIEINELIRCDFIDCNNLAIKSGSSEKNIIKDCLFKNINNTTTVYSFIELHGCEFGNRIESCTFLNINNSGAISGMIYITRHRGDEVNRITGCNFENIKSKCTIIHPSIPDAKKYQTVGIMENCFFSDCDTGSSPIVEKNIHEYTFLLGKRKEYADVVKIFYCKGI